MATQTGSGQLETQTATPMLRAVGRTGQSELAFNRLNLLLCGFGAALHLAAYLSLLPMVVAGVFYGVAYLVLSLTRLGGRSELAIFNRTFAVGWVVAGVAAIYANHFHDAGQLYSDAGSFYEMAASQQAGDLSLIELQLMHEGALAIVLWAAVYDFFATLGFPRERYVGIIVNVTAVAVTAVVTLKMARLVYGDDPYRFRRLTLLFSACGLFWLFAGIHIRDSIVLLAVTLLAYAWLKFLSKPNFGMSLLKITGASLLAGSSLVFLRGDFVFVPIAMAVAAIASLLLGRVNRRRRRIAYGMAAVGIAVIIILFSIFGDSMLYILLRGNEGYAELAAEESSADSLGLSLIINQALPIRILLGSGYLFLFPIPFWSGFQLDSAYALFKSFNVIFIYFIIPLLLMTVWQLWKRNESRSAFLLFLLFLSLGFTMAIAGTSLETRHFGVFLPSMFLLALLPDLREKINLKNYRKILVLVLGGVFSIHFSWLVMKEGAVYLVLALLFFSLSSAALVTERKHKYTLLFFSFAILGYLAAPFLKMLF